MVRYSRRCRTGMPPTATVSVSHSSSKGSTTTTRRVWRTILLMQVGAFDNLHRDRIEMFSGKDHSSRGVLNLEGSLNADKSEKPRKRKGPMYRK